jgi:hypothetical protein
MGFRDYGPLQSTVRRVDSLPVSESPLLCSLYYYVFFFLQVHCDAGDCVVRMREARLLSGLGLRCRLPSV